MPATFDPGSKVPKFPLVNAEGPDHIPVTSGVPPNSSKRLEIGSVGQKLIVPSDPAFGPVVNVTIISAVASRQEPVPATV